MNKPNVAEKLGNGLECLTCRIKDTVHKIPIPFLPENGKVKQILEKV